MIIDHLLTIIPGAFFYFLLINFFATLTMSMIFRSIAALSRSFVAAMTPAAVIMIGLIVYTGFAIPVNYMHGWSRWINYIDPIAYAFESLMINEFHGRDYTCSMFVPSGLPAYTDATPMEQVCSAVGSVAGQGYVNGDRYMNLSYSYYHSHKWRNFGILIGFMLFFLGVYLAATGKFLSSSPYFKSAKSECRIRIGETIQRRSSRIPQGPNPRCPTLTFYIKRYRV
jgi:ATP-binding cassette subfamily G (WHITE) protein 2 (PDR)